MGFPMALRTLDRDVLKSDPLPEMSRAAISTLIWLGAACGWTVASPFPSSSNVSADFEEGGL